MKADPKLNNASEQADTASFSVTTDFNYCGIIMPIAAMGDYEKGHWERVRQIIDQAIIDAGFAPKMVSESADIGVIHSRIVQNIYNNPIVVCDVSGKNPNVMFELGLRLAFDKPVIIIKDDETNYSFDTSPIEHLEYRKDLRYQDSLSFIKSLTERIKATLLKSRTDSEYSPFLRHFGTFKVAELEQKTVTAEELILSKIDELQRSVGMIATYSDVSKKIASNLDANYLPGVVRIIQTRNDKNKVNLANIITKLSHDKNIDSLDELISLAMPIVRKSDIAMDVNEVKNFILHNIVPPLKNSKGENLY